MSLSSDPTTTSFDPVCGMRVPPGAQRLTHAGVTYGFCEDACAEIFAADPSRWVVPFRHAPADADAALALSRDLAVRR